MRNVHVFVVIQSEEGIAHSNCEISRELIEELLKRAPGHARDIIVHEAQAYLHAAAELWEKKAYDAR